MKGKEDRPEAKTYIVEVAPISKSPLTNNLSYFSTEKVPVGTFVKIEIRHRKTMALVVGRHDVRSVKSDVRRAGFTLRKIRKSDILPAKIDKHTLEALKELAHYYIAPLGTLLNLLIPKLLSDEPSKFFNPKHNWSEKEVNTVPETFLLQMESEERLGQYRALVRQNFARKKSVLFLVPTHHDVLRLKGELEHGIEEFVYPFSLELKPEAIKSTWQKAQEEKHPILFITTPAGLLFSRTDLETMVVERANSRAYRHLARPYPDMRGVAECITKHRGEPLTIGDSVLPIELLWREKSGYRKRIRGVSELSLLRWRLPASNTRIVDSSIKQDESGNFQIFSTELKELISKALERHPSEAKPGGIFLFGARKGLAPTTVCGDCGTVLPCENCGAPVVLHRRGETTIYICHACGGTRDSNTVCGHCQSWRLTPLGIGVEEIARQAEALYPNVPIHILDKDHAPTDKKALMIAKRFEAEGGIMVGTELAFYHLNQTPYSALVSIDALFSIPDFYINERVFYLVSRLREMTRTETLIQTRNIGRQVLAWATYGNITDFYQSEITDRESLLYPPFSTFIKISVADREHLPSLQRVAESLNAWRPDFVRSSLVIRIPREAWPDSELWQKLSLLGPEFSIKVDPESII